MASQTPEAMLDTIRYGLAFLTLGSLPFAVGYWYVIHPFAAFWRRRGPVLTYSFLSMLLVANLAAAWVWREALLATSYPVGPVHWGTAGAVYVAAIAMERSCRKQLKFRILAGLPELSTGQGPGELLQSGVYARIRHPRYVSVMLGMLAAAVFCSYLSVWIAALLTAPGLYGIVVLEERELRDRFGAAYRDYESRVPRFLPRRAR